MYQKKRDVSGKNHPQPKKIKIIHNSNTGNSLPIAVKKKKEITYLFKNMSKK